MIDKVGSMRPSCHAASPSYTTATAVASRSHGVDMSSDGPMMRKSFDLGLAASARSRPRAICNSRSRRSSECAS